MTEIVRPTARVLLFDADDRLLLFLTRWHHLVDRVPRWMSPGGGIEPGESEEVAARRELLEETGYEAREMEQVAEGPPSAGISDEVMTLFIARGLRKTGAAEGDGSEDITVHEVAVDKVPAFLRRKAREGCMIDLKVYGGLYFVQQDAAKPTRGRVQGGKKK